MQKLRGASSWRGYVGLSLVWLVVLGVALLLMRRPSAQPIEILPAPTAAPKPSPTAQLLRVDVTGAVRAPGVYTLFPDSIVADAIAAAGGANPDAALDLVNKAVPLQDGMQIRVPSIQAAGAPLLSNVVVLATAPEPVAAAVTPEVTVGLARIININTATLEELDTLPGIGPALAQRIVAGRPYGKTDDLLRVDGIGAATFNKLKDQITVQ